MLWSKLIGGIYLQTYSFKNEQIKKIEKIWNGNKNPIKLGERKLNWTLLADHVCVCMSVCALCIRSLGYNWMSHIEGFDDFLRKTIIYTTKRVGLICNRNFRLKKKKINENNRNTRANLFQFPLESDKCTTRWITYNKMSSFRSFSFK